MSGVNKESLTTASSATLGEDGLLSLEQRIKNVFSFLYAEKPDDNCYFDRGLLDEIKAAALRGASAPSETAPITADQLAEVKDQCEAGLTFSPEHNCPATYALSAIWAELFANAAPQASPSVAPAVHVGPAVAAPDDPLSPENIIAASVPSARGCNCPRCGYPEVE